MYNNPVKNYGPTTFGHADGKVWLKQLFGVTCGFCGRDEGPLRTRCPVSLRSDSGVVDASSLILTKSSLDNNSAHFVWRTKFEELIFESFWEQCEETGIWSRKDRLVNAATQVVSILRCLARFTFTPGEYEAYSQASRWCNENQGLWQRLSHGSMVLACEGGRTSQGATPYVCLREIGTSRAVAFHILPLGNWKIRLTCHTWMNSLPFVVVELGLSDENLHLTLQPGESFDLPEILMQPLPAGRPELATGNLHGYLLNRCFAKAKDTVPVVYNTWFDDFEHLDVPRLHRQLAAAKEIGCEVFVVDAGWYGAGSGSWHEQTGDWREKPDAAFKGNLAGFADEVRAAGLGFGLWMEPERICPAVPVLREHPEWFLRGPWENFYPNLQYPQAYAHVLSEMSRLIETYALVWMKIDFNFEIGPDPASRELAGYYEAWYRLIEELRSKYPQVFFEGCSSGGMRLEASSHSHFDGDFLSDTTEPIDILRIFQGAMLRLPPGRIIKWIALRSVGKSIASYGVPIELAPTALVAPGGATWDGAVSTDVDFAARVCTFGVPGLSGDIASLPAEARGRLGHHVRFFKTWRTFIAKSFCHLLTPPRAKTDRSGWAAMQLQHACRKENLLFVYRLEDFSGRKTFRPVCLFPDVEYVVDNIDSSGANPSISTGAELMSVGIEVELSKPRSAAVIIISPK